MKKTIFILLFLLTLISLGACNDSSNKLEKILVTSDTLEVEAGDTLTLNYQLIPSSIEVEVKWEILEGKDFASIDANSLLIDEEALPNSEIKVKASYLDIESEAITIKVVKYLTNITISASSDFVEAGESVVLTAIFDPVDATDIDVVWSIIEGSEYAFIDSENDALVARSSAVAGTEIKIQATSGTIKSDPLIFTVYDPKIDELYLFLPHDEMTIDKNNITKTIEARIYDGHLEIVPDKEVIYTVVAGEDFLELDCDGQNCELIAKGHGTATLRATIKGTNISKTMTIDVIVPPIALELPEVFAERINYLYTVGQGQELPYALNAIKDSDTNSICEDIIYSFSKKGSIAPSAEIGRYEDGKIVFLTDGEITVKAKSDSGSKAEVEKSYTFNVNDGINVNSFEEFKATIHGKTERLINIVVLDKVLPNHPQYGYDLVPAHIIDFLQDGIDQPFDIVQGTVIYGEGSYEIIGNNHRINLEDQRHLTIEEYEDYKRLTGNDVKNIDDFIQFRPIHNDPNYRIYISDLEIKGNCGIDYSGSFSDSSPKPDGVHRYAMYINKRMINPYNDLEIAVDTKIENVKVSNFSSGIFFRNAYLGLAKDVEVANIFGTGISVASSSITYQDITLGPCGASSLEMIPEGCTAAPTALGETAEFTKNQEVRFIGEFNCTNYNDGNTIYLANYQKELLADITVVDIIRTNMLINEDAKDNVMNDQNEILFAALIFNEFTSTGPTLNETEIYNDWGENAIIYYEDMLENDTTHKYVMVPLNVIIAGATYPMGYAICYNLNYSN